MSRLKQVTLLDFANLLERAQEEHITRSEPIPDMSPYNLGRVESCLLTPFQSFFGIVAYKGFSSKAAILFYLLAKGHALENGNKRMAVATLEYFCFINMRILALTNDDLKTLAVYVAKSQAEDKDEVVKRIERDLAQNLFKVNLRHLVNRGGH